MLVPKPPKLLSRKEFRESVFKRDNHKCVFCDKPAQQAHHILERRLWPDGGYYLENGASVCAEHHIACETTEISIDDVRHACGISKIIVPPHLYPEQPYDKWGNPILPNGNRIKGEMFHDDSVQKILNKAGVLQLFTHWVKYPRTYHVPWSEGIPVDDKIVDSMASFIGKRVIVTEKMDGENTTMYHDHIHARSVDSKNHWSRNWIKAQWSQIRGDIPEYFRICGENLYATHSIKYHTLPSYFMGFSIWDGHNQCLSWDDTLEWFELFELEHVSVLYDGKYNENTIRELYKNELWDISEGYVIRVADSFDYSQFRFNVAKFVRKNHIQTTKHWMRARHEIEVNELAK